MTAENLSRDECLAQFRAGDGTMPEGCAAVLEKLPWFTSQGEGTMILLSVLAAVVVGNLVLNSRQARRRRLKSIRTPKV